MTCRCAERRAAMKRAYDAKARGDLETMRKELRFIAQSSLEDMQAAVGMRRVERSE